MAKLRSREEMKVRRRGEPLASVEQSVEWLLVAHLQGVVFRV